MIRTTYHIRLTAAWHKACSLRRAVHHSTFIFACAFVMMLAGLMTISCIREPELHLPKRSTRDIEIPIVDLDLIAYWDYVLDYGINYDWRAEWVCGWDREAVDAFGDSIGYVDPEVFILRRYYTKQEQYGPHTSVLENSVRGRTFHGDYNWGFWDILVWSDVPPTKDDVQNLNIDDHTTLDSVVAFTNQSMRTSRYQAPRYTRAFYQPEQLFSAYARGIEINEDLEGFKYDSIRNVWVKELDMTLEPITYIYLTQIILHHNRGKIKSVDGDADISSMAQSTNVNTGVASIVPVDVYYNVLFKPGVTLPERCRDFIDIKEPGEVVDVVYGRLLTFGICSQNGNRIKQRADVRDTHQHFLDLNMGFNNGVDSTFVFDITDKVRNRWKGGVITLELDMDTIPVPQRSGGSAFDAIVKDYEDGGTHEFVM